MGDVARFVSSGGLGSYRDPEKKPYPFCPGCGHGLILNHLDAALVRLQLDPRQVVIVSDIGCVGLSDQYFHTNAFHGLHGRSVTYATGIKLANPDLKVIVLMGDGGCGIGGHHLINAARRNVDVTVILFNNLNFGMTGGEHSVTTPHGATTATTRRGNLERPMDVCATVAVNGAGFVARKTSFDRDLPELLAEAIAFDGFALIDVWELCTAYFVPNNKFSKKALEATLDELGFATGVLHREERPEFSRAYRRAAAEQRGEPALPLRAFDPTSYTSTVTRRQHVVIAGAAGQRVRSTARAFGLGAALSGLHVTQRDDYPPTVMSGHSVSEVILSPDEIGYTGVRRPDRMVVVAPEGLEEVRHHLAAMADEQTVFVASNLLPLETQARIVELDVEHTPVRVTRRELAMMAVAAMLKQTELYPMDAFRQAIREGQRPGVAEANLRLVDAGEEWVS
jgi:pyruvate/2-oxoacid:ferredoxin oxidoreductase beta subunit/Pyruvate/2-oxoacid:ferredoxin oxidoreductase gamma subunit